MKKAILFTILTIFVTSLIIPAALSAATRGIRVISKEGQDLNLYEGYYALVVGVSDYKKWPDLPYAVNDAKEVAQRLKELGFEVKLVLNPDSRELKRAINEMTYGAGRKRNRAILFYYAGHGETETMADDTKMGYIIPKDCPLLEKDPIGFNTHAISMREIESVSLRIRSKHVLMLFDSCFSGALFALIRAVPNDITEKSALPVRQYITAGREDEQVPDKSMFKRCFLIGLKGGADLTGDGYITGSEMGMYLADNVVNYTRRRQHPQYGKINNPDLDQGDFIFVPLKTRFKEVEQEKKRRKQELALAEQVKRMQEQIKTLFDKKGETEKKTKDALIEKKYLEEKLRREAEEHRRKETLSEAKIRDLEAKHKASLEKLEKEATAKTVLAAELKRQRIIEKELKKAEDKRKKDEQLAEERIKKLEAERIAVEKQLQEEAATKQVLEEELKKKKEIEQELKQTEREQQAAKGSMTAKITDLDKKRKAAEEKTLKESAAKKALEDELNRVKSKVQKTTQTIQELKSKQPEKTRLAYIPKKAISDVPSPGSIDSRLKEIARDGRFIAYSDGTVLDTKTNLMWAAKDNGKGLVDYDVGEYIENYRVGGYADWRLPTMGELKTIHNSKVKNSNGYHVTKLIDITGEWVWGSKGWGNKWAFDFNRGSEAIKGHSSYAFNPEYWNSSARALPVRFRNKALTSVETRSKTKEIARDGRFTAYANGTVLDTKTNLMWAGSDAGVESLYHSNATSYCEGYRGGGHTDWRMPTLDELETLYNKKLSNEHGYHITKFINVGTDYIWADHSSWGGPAVFNFKLGSPAVGGHYDAGKGNVHFYSARALPVRTGN